MFTQPATSSPGVLPPLTPSAPTTATTPATSSSIFSGRANRLRGLIHLRSYTHNHHSSSHDSHPPNHNNNNNNNNNNNHNNHHHHPQNDNSSSSSSSSGSGSGNSRRSSRHYHFLHHENTQATTTPTPPTNTNTTTTATATTANTATRFGSASEHLPHVDVIYLDETTRRTIDRSATDSWPTRRRTTKFSEAACEALLQSRSAPAANPGTSASPSASPSDMTRTRSATTGDLSSDMLPSIRLSAFYDARSTRPSLSFTPVARTLPTGKEHIKVGRYSERENHTPVPINTPSSAPVGFKSKVVSRRHCEFWYENGKWNIKDVGSSSGTFLNHIRLSAPGTESKPFPVNDGDIVQLGIDFKGGEEMIYRCVKMRVELNRGWQAKPNTFNMANYKRLRDMTAASSTSHAQDCSICLCAIAPCQSLFVAPCSHTWHYKCIREMLTGPTSPIFMCPNCRATADLDAEVDEPSDDWQQFDSGAEDVREDKSEHRGAQTTDSPSALNLPPNSDEKMLLDAPKQGDIGDVTVHLDSAAMETEAPLRQTSTEPVPIPNATSRVASRERRTPSPNGNPLTNGHEGPITPRNDAGPWVFDGNPERLSQESTRRDEMSSLDAAAQTDPSDA